MGVARGHAPKVRSAQAKEVRNRNQCRRQLLEQEAVGYHMAVAGRPYPHKAAQCCWDAPTRAWGAEEVHAGDLRRPKGKIMTWVSIPEARDWGKRRPSEPSELEKLSQRPRKEPND